MRCHLIRASALRKRARLVSGLVTRALLLAQHRPRPHGLVTHAARQPLRVTNALEWRHCRWQSVGARGSGKGRLIFLYAQ